MCSICPAARSAPPDQPDGAAWPGSPAQPATATTGPAGAATATGRRLHRTGTARELGKHQCFLTGHCKEYVVFFKQAALCFVLYSQQQNIGGNLSMILQ